MLESPRSKKQRSPPMHTTRQPNTVVVSRSRFIVGLLCIVGQRHAARSLGRTAQLLIVVLIQLFPTAQAEDKHWIGLNQQGLRALGAGDAAAAERAFNAAIDRAKALPDADRELASSLNNLGLTYRQIGRQRDAEELFRHALKLRFINYGSRHPYYAESLNNLGQTLQELGQYRESEGYFEQAISLYIERFGTKHPVVADVLNNLGSLHVRTGRLVSAERYLRRAIDIQSIAFGDRHPRVAVTLSNLASVAVARDDLQTAESLYKKVIEIRSNGSQGELQGLVLAMNNLGVVHHRQCQLEDAEEILVKALDTIEEKLSGSHPQHGLIQYQLAKVAAALRRYAIAQSYFEAALITETRTAGPAHARLVPILENFALTLFKLKRPDQAQVKLARAREIRRRANLPSQQPKASGCTPSGVQV